MQALRDITAPYVPEVRLSAPAVQPTAPVHFMSLADTTVDVVAQGKVRRGSFAAYLDIESPDIMEFLECREEGSNIQNLSLGVCVSDNFMQEMIDGDSEKRKVWARVLRKRRESGYPYIFFSDTVNNNKPQVPKG